MHVSIAIVVAMESERRHLDTLMPGWEPVPGSVWPTLRNDDVVCITSGIGMVAAAAATEHAIATYAPSTILNFGCAGAHHSDLFPGDVVIGDKVVHQGRMRFAPDGTRVPFTIGFQVPGEVNPITNLASDATLFTLATEVAQSRALPAWPAKVRLPQQPDRAPLVKQGTVSSGDIWLQNAEMIGETHALTGSLCEDMEAASIAQICALHGVPFLTVKDISNSELQEATEFVGTSSALHSDELGMRAAMVIVGVLEHLRQNGGLQQDQYS